MIFKPHDVILAQITARLHLNDLQRNGAWVGKAVDFTERNVSALVFGKQDGLVPVGDFSGTGDDDPVLRPMVVLLQAEAGLGLDLDALDLEAPAFVDAVVPAPGTVHLAVQGVLPAPLLIEGIDDVLDVLAAGFVGNEHGIRGFDDDQVVDADDGDEAAGGVDQGVAAVAGEHVAVAGIAVFVSRQDVPDGVPGAEIAPAGGERNHAHGEGAAWGFFHDCIVDRFTGNLLEKRLGRADEGVVGGSLRPGPCAGGGDVGAEMFERSQPDRSLEDKHAGIPVVAAFGEISLGSGEVGLFDETLYQRAGFSADRFDVAVAGFRLVRRDTENDDAALLRTIDGLLQRLPEGGFVADGLVGRRHHEDGVRAILPRRQCRQGQRRRGIAANWFEQESSIVDTCFAQLLLGEKTVFFVANYIRAAGPRHALQTPGGLLEEAVVAGQAEKLLGKAGTGKRPQAGAGTAAKDDGLNELVHGLAPVSIWESMPGISARSAESSCCRAMYSASLRAR